MRGDTTYYNGPSVASGKPSSLSGSGIQTAKRDSFVLNKLTTKYYSVIYHGGVSAKCIIFITCLHAPLGPL